MLAAVVSSALACCSVFAERLLFPAEISDDAACTLLVESRTSTIAFCMRAKVVCNARLTGVVAGNCCAASNAMPSNWSTTCTMALNSAPARAVRPKMTAIVTSSDV